MTPFEIVAIFGAITGSVSLAIILYRISKERPRLIFNVERHYWYLSDPQHANGTNISIAIRIDNKGERSTTIHKSSLSFSFKGKTYEPRRSPNRLFTVLPHETKRESFEFFLPFTETRIEGDTEAGRLFLEHTHGKKELHIPKINKL